MRRQRIFHSLIVTVIVFALFFAILLNSSAAESSDLPTGVHLTWQESDMATTITVTWQTHNSDSGDTIAYDTFSRGGNAELYSYAVSGESHTYVGASGYIHDVELTNLEPNSTYYFVCGGTQGGYSDERSFTTATIQPSSFRFVAGSDCRSNSTQRDIVSLAMSKFNPEFVLLSGDFVDSGVIQTQWDSFFYGLHSYWIGNDNRTIPIVPCLGNHEENATNYYEQFALPGNEQWYSLNWGNYVHITVLNSGTTPSGEQLSWLEEDLASHRDYTWKFVMFHRPIFSPSHHGNWTEGQKYWCPIFDKYGVDIVFSGHNHDYERSKPINYSASKNSPQDSYSEGTMYVVSGGWGAPLYTSGTNSLTAFTVSVNHFVVVDVFANGTLNLRAIDTQGEKFDEVTQKKPVIPEFPLFLPLLSLFILSTLLAVIIRRKHGNLGLSRGIRLLREIYDKANFRVLS